MGAGVVAGGLCDCRGVGKLLFFWRRFYVYIFILSMLSAGVFLDAFGIGFYFGVCGRGDTYDTRQAPFTPCIFL
jgi:hypothetical protein